MSTSARSVIALLLLLAGFGLGYLVARERTSLPRPVRPATAEEVELWTQQKDELRAILMEPNVLMRAQRLATRLNEYGPEGVPAVVTLLQAGAFGMGSVEASLLTRFWASYDPKAAADWAVTQAQPFYIRPIVAETAVEVYAMQDPEGIRPMLAIYTSQVSDPVAEAAQSAFVRGWYESGKPGVETAIQALGPGGPQARLLTILAQQIIYQHGAQAAIDWLDAFPIDDERLVREAYRAVAPELAKADRPLALAWCEQHCEKGHGEHVRALIARAWAREDGPAAMAWVRTAPAGDERDRAVWATFTHWRETDPRGLLAWIDELGLEGAGPWLYPAVDRIAMWKSWDHPLEAYRWAAMIPDEGRRERALITISHRYREIDPAGADAWIDQSPLSEEARKKAREVPPSFKGRGDRPIPEAFREE